MKGNRVPGEHNIKVYKELSALRIQEFQRIEKDEKVHDSWKISIIKKLQNMDD